MPKVDTEMKKEIELLPKDDLIKLVIKAAGQSQDFFNYLLVNHIDKEGGEAHLFEQAKNDLQKLFFKGYKGFSDELRLANMLAACNKRIIEFSKSVKNKKLELDLIMIVLEVPFSMSTNSFTTCFTKYNYQVSLLVKKAITIIKTKLHEDYKLDYLPIINNYLDILHRTSNYLDYIYALPESIE